MNKTASAAHRAPLSVSLAFGALIPGLVIRLSGTAGHVPPLGRSGIYGLAIVGASLLLTWSAEVAQLDVSPAVAIAGLALVAVLPEYVVGAVFAWRGGHAVHRFGAACQSAAQQAAGHSAACSLALANMMGANRLLIGIGWSLVVLVAWRRTRTRHDRLLRGVVLGREHSVELSFLALASLWCLTLPFRRSVGLVDSAVLFAVFAGYGFRLFAAPSDGAGAGGRRRVARRTAQDAEESGRHLPHPRRRRRHLPVRRRVRGRARRQRVDARRQ